MSEPAITIRYGSTKDNQLLSAFGAQAFSDTFAADNTAENMAAYLAGAFSPETQAQELADPNSIFLIAEIDHQATGFAHLKKGHAPEIVSGQHPIELARLYAGKAWIGQGVGKALMQACLDEARRLGCDLIWLGVWEHNLRAQAFYRKWGFTIAGTQSFLLGSDLQTDYVMQRAVN